MSEIVRMMASITKLGTAHNNLCAIVEKMNARVGILEKAVKDTNEEMKVLSDELEKLVSQAPGGDDLNEGEEVVG
jgi:chaperonin cofactor prefoldin